MKLKFGFEGARCARGSEDVVELTLEVQHRDEKPTLYCHGHLICGHEAEALLAAVARLLSNSQHVIVDLKDVRKIDCGGIGALAAAVCVARQHGKSLELSSIPRKVRLMMQMTGLYGVLTMAEPSRKTAGVVAA